MSRPRNWYSIRNLADAGTEVSIYDEIGLWGVSAKAFIDEVKGLAPGRLTVRLNTPGGSVFDGLAIYNFLKGLPDVTVKVDGLAASIGSIIMLAGKRIEAASNAFVMIHNPSGVAMGEADDMRETAALLDKITDTLVNTYATRTGKDAETVRGWMNAETWFTAGEAQAAGLVDAVTEELAVAACSTDRFANPPAKLVQAHAAPATVTANSGPTITTTISAGGNNPAPTNTRQNTMQNIITALVEAKVLASSEIADDKLAETIAAAFAALTAERDTLKAQVAGAAKAEATRTVEAAIAQGRITAEKKDHWVTELLTNANAKELLAAIQPANLGAEPVKVAPTAKTRDTLLAEFNAIADPKARTNFWRSHKKDLLSN